MAITFKSEKLVNSIGLHALGDDWQEHNVS